MQTRFLFSVLLLLCCYGFLQAQQVDVNLLDFNQAGIAHQKVAMLTLGGWAVLNIGSGLALQGSADGATKHFHRMNAMWNGVNLAIAGFGYYSAMKSDPAGWDLVTSLGEHNGFQKILLFNAGLDVGYIMGGLYLTERAKRPDVNSDQLKGFGQSIMLQGAFLMVFDLANYFISSGRNGEMDLLLQSTSNGLGLTFIF